MAIISILVALSLAGVSAARETAQKAHCENNTRQLAIAAQTHVSVHHHFPSGGWGYRWAGDADRGFGVTQPGGWVFNILPFIEAGNVRDINRGVTGEDKLLATGKLLRTTVAVFQCPSRRVNALYPYSEDVYGLRNSVPVYDAAKSDYAINAGDRVVRGFAGPEYLLPVANSGYKWPNNGRYSGISFVISRVRAADIRDGLSNTLLLGEKALNHRDYEGGSSIGDDQAMCIGDDADIRRFAADVPVSDSIEGDAVDRFGGPHSGVCVLALCDGSVRQIAFEVDLEAFKAMGNRSDSSTAAVAPE